MGDAAAADARLRRAAAADRARLPGHGRGAARRARGCSPARSPTRCCATCALALLVALGMASYAAAVFATGALRAADIRAALRRG